jgi:tetraacyldisaccharide 4'-kinase
MRNLLLPLSLLHRTGARVVDRLYALGIRRARSAPLPVVSVGNLHFGGSEKTPLSIHLIERFLEWGHRPALVTRGYRGKWEKTGGVLSDGRDIRGGWREGGDEPYMVARRCPRAGVMVGRDRLAGCRRAAELGFDVAVLDDGFQHRALARDLDILLYRREGAEIRREFESALARCHIILARSDRLEDLRANLERRSPGAALFGYRVVHRGFQPIGAPSPAPRDPAGKTTLAVCGIARPDRFAASLRELGLEPADRIEFPDHHGYPASSLDLIRKRAESCGASIILTTEKDAVKLEGRLDGMPPAFYLEIGLSLPADFDARLRAVLDPPRAEPA